mmetsp:Transcript_12800/g.22007  ORF Transcript_12800/g.22007 Transcript_12800/m.22007 type:complete len:275 (-) Transcript_12800:133-957(-)
MLRFIMRTKNVTAEMTSAPNVASAAPGTPIARVNISMGSRTALKMFDAALILRGVDVSRVPRNAEKPINEIKEGRNANALMNRYGLAYWSAGAPSFNTDDRIFSGYFNINAVPTSEIPKPTNKAWQTASCKSSWLPLAFALLTNVAVTLGKTDTIQNADENTWFAAACPATASAFPMRFTQNKSTAPTSGLMAKFAIQGRAILIIRLSRSSICGQLETISSSSSTFLCVEVVDLDDVFSTVASSSPSQFIAFTTSLSVDVSDGDDASNADDLDK